MSEHTDDAGAAEPPAAADVEEAGRVKPPTPKGLPAALEYLRQWSAKAAEWKFQRNRQKVLLAHACCPEHFPKADFKLALAYAAGLRGAGRQRLREECAAAVAAEAPHYVGEGAEKLDAKRRKRAAAMQGVLAGDPA